MDIGTLHFQNPEAFWLLLFVPLLIALYVYRQQRRKSTIKFPALALAKKAVPSRRVKFRHIVPALRLAALVCFVVALARPQNAMEVEYTSTDGVDIMLALDVSGSMGTLDMLTRTEQAKLGTMNAEKFLKRGEYWKFSRLGYAQDVIAEFIGKRHSDRIGLSAFGARSFTQCPLTMDYGSLLEILKASDDLARDTLVNNRTAIGDGLMNALARLKMSDAKSRVVILLTDGRDNASVVPPVRAAEVAKSLGVKVYTVGVGKKSGKILSFQQNPWTGEISWGERDITTSRLRKALTKAFSRRLRQRRVGVSTVPKTRPNLKRFILKSMSLKRRKSRRSLTPAMPKSSTLGSWSVHSSFCWNSSSQTPDS